MFSRSSSSSASAALLLLLCSSICLLTAVNAQFGLTSPQPRTTGEQQFNPNNKGTQAQDDYCGSGSILNNQPISALFIGSPANYINTQSNNLNPGAGARVVISLIVYQQNGTSFNPNNNVTTPIFYKQNVFVVYNDTATLTSGNGQQYSQMLTLDTPHLCGSPSAVDPTHTQTRCVLRWVYDNTANGQNSRVSCADVIVMPRSDATVTLQVAMQVGDVPVTPATALNRLLTSNWASTADYKFDIFNLPGSTDYNSNEIRLATAAIVPNGMTYSMNFVISSTIAYTGDQLAGSLKAQDLPTMFDLAVTTATTGVLGSAATLVIQPITVVVTLALSLLLLARA